MDTTLVPRILETYHQARTLFDALVQSHGVDTRFGVRKAQVQRVGFAEAPGQLRYRVMVEAAPTQTAHERMALAAFRAGFDATVAQQVGPFLETLAEAMPLCHAPYGSLALTHQQNQRPWGNIDGEPTEPPAHRLLLQVNGVVVQGENPRDPNALTWTALLAFVRAVQHLPPPTDDDVFSRYKCPSVVAASQDDAETIWRAAKFV